MRSEIGRALRRELRQVRVDEGLKARILAGAARESGAYRRRRARRWPGVAVAAAVILLAGSVGLLMHLRAEHPDVQRPAVLETTALGAALLAGLAVGMYSDLKETAAGWHVADTFEPHMEEALRQEKIHGWRRAVDAALHWAEER